MAVTTTSIINLTSKFLADLPLKRTFKLIVEEGIKVSGADYGTLVLERKNGVMRVYSNIPKELGIKPRPKTGMHYKVAKSNKIIVLSHEELVAIRPEFKNTEVMSVVGLPLSDGTETIGAITFSFKKSIKKNDPVVRQLSHYALMASLAIKKSQHLEQMKKALATRDLFISSAAHELRTPLTSMTLYSQILKKKIESGQNADLVLYNRLLNSIFRMSSLVATFLSIDEIKTGKFHCELKKCDLLKIINQSANDFHNQYPNFKLVVTRDLPEKHRVRVNGDSTKLAEVFTNILNNAAKYSPEGSLININLSQNEADYIVSIQDHGKGMEKIYVQRVFRKFFRIKDNFNKGMGLGLYLSKNIIQQHKGKILIDSELNQGTRVEISIPKYIHGR